MVFVGVFVWDHGGRGLFSFLTCNFPCKSLIFVSLATVECIGDYFDNRQCGANCSVRFPSLNDLFCCDTKGDRDSEEDRESKGDRDEEVNGDREEIQRGGIRR
jgi:hypothetical protein